MIRLLGPFALFGGSEQQPLARRPAILLAALAVRIGTPVSYDALTELVWSEEDLPANARRAIQTYASRLRDVLGREAIVAQGDGLLLDLDPDRVDLHRFRRLVTTRTEQAASAREELDTLTEALGLWTGPPLSGLASERLAEVEAPAILDEILSVVERSNDLRLQLDDIDDALVASLRRMTAEHPWRERTWCHLMLALYRTGQQGEALTTFSRLVDVLREDLGIDPGAEATQLHQRMLAGDQDLLLPARPEPTASPSPPAPTPAQLPAGSPAFVGRRRELDALGALLERPADRVRVAVVSGPAGVGKTTTVLEAAHRARARFPDGQLFAEGTSGGTAVAARDVLGSFLRDLGIAGDDIPSSTADRAALFRSICARKRLLVLVDDAHSADQITALLPGAGECAVLVTSRRRLALPANLSVDLDTISATESRELLATLVGADRLAAEPEAATAIVETCAGSPLALLIVGGRLATRPSWPLAHLRDRLAGPGRLAELRLDGRSVAAALDATTGTLEPPDEARFRELGALPIDVVDVDSAAALWRVGRAEAGDLLEQLCDVRLLEPTTPGCYGWHSLIGSYLRDGPRPHTEAGRRRVLRQAIASVANARDRLRPGDRSHHAVIAAAIAADDSDGVTFPQLSDLHAWLHPRTLLLISLASVGLASADDEEAVEAAALVPLLDSVLTECCTAHEITEDLLRAVTTAPLPPSAIHFVASARHNLAATLSDQGRLHEAMAGAEEAIATWRHLGDAYGEAAMLHNLGLLHSRLGDFTTAVEVMRQCLAAADALPAVLRLRCQRTYAYLLARHGDAAAALETLQATRKLAVPEPGSRELHDEFVAEAAAHLTAGEPEAAIAVAEMTIATVRQMGSDRLTAQAKVLLARARRLAGQDSLETAADALQLLLGHHDVQTKCEALAELALAHEAAGDTGSARACAAEAGRLIGIAGLRGTPWATSLFAELDPEPSHR
ncbi:AfsR/SARP family transcriptional regulator [Jiangella mangrovi]|uniref:DNA-binding SARP family transcriptional activator/tetratricopeptide (TPR) repeat protein n=1 Tax=Jiangella mangrovi TaxID=1524084 RepID=A0A7W9LJT9_9ACTN|nr:AfsR/SARP family transcriptional regulator [Jiangella mangrovi]MBB5786416.1 DNA-binding SARP family transcriptional activator/tetratricopeptide (TPR) repeat protein [Jiangella mangrovi]